MKKILEKLKNYLIKVKNDIIKSIKGLTITRIITYSAIIIFSVAFIIYGQNIKYATSTGDQAFNNNKLDSYEYVKAKVVDTYDVWRIYETDKETGEKTDVLLEIGYIYLCELLEGENKGGYTYVIQRISSLPTDIKPEDADPNNNYGFPTQYNNKATEGSKIYVRAIESESLVLSLLTNNPDKENIMKEMSQYKVFLLDSDQISYDHSGTLIALVVGFFVLILIFSRSKGFHTVMALGLTCAAILFVYIPAVLAGQNIYLWTIIICAYAIIVTLTLLEGITKKTLASAIGCAFGVLVSGLLCVITNKTMNIIGYNGEIADAQSQIAQAYYPAFDRLKTLSMRGIIFSACTFGALGAIMDTAMSIASSLFEVYENSSEHSIARTMKSGINIGKDMLGTMSITLVLAYLSTSLATTLYYVSHFYPEMIFRTEFFALAIAQAFIGCIGILVTIPLTSLVCALLYNKKDEWFKKKEEISVEEIA